MGCSPSTAAGSPSKDATTLNRHVGDSAVIEELWEASAST